MKPSRRWLLAALVLTSACSRGSSGGMPTPEPTQTVVQPSPATREEAPSTPAATAPAMPAPGAMPAPAVTGSPIAPGGTAEGGGGTNQPGMRSGTANPFDEHGGLNAAAGTTGECARDEDCVCGIDRSTGACAVGPASRVDTGHPCPDFCGGVGGQLRVLCDHGRCAQR